MSSLSPSRSLHNNLVLHIYLKRHNTEYLQKNSEDIHFDNDAYDGKIIAVSIKVSLCKACIV